jgi:hypothetical protein
MSKKIVCISFINESVEFVEVERSKINSFTLSPSFAFTNESFEREIFPKVQERFLHPLVTNFVQKQNPGLDISVRYQHIRDVVMDGNPSPLIAIQSVNKTDIENILVLFKRFRHKIKNIYSLPTALAGAVVHSEKPTGNSMFLWIKENIALIAAISADGVVDIARSLPYGIQGGENSDTERLAAADFSEDISREVIMTANYFKQNFREPAPEKLYILGDERLQKIFADFPIEFPGISVHFGLSGSLPKGIDPGKLNEKVHLLGSIFANEAFSFLPLREVENRKLNRVLSGVMAGVMLLIVLAGLWVFSIPDARSHNDLIDQAHNLRFDIQEIETAITDLKPVEARKKFYQSAFLDKKPGFITVLQQVAAIAPPEMVFESFTMSPADNIWNCLIAGKIKGKNWQERLTVLREFGNNLYSFSNFDIQNINHSLGQAGINKGSISFQVSLQFIPGEKKK